MSISENYNLWLQNAVEDKDLHEELLSIKDNEEEIYDRFYKELSFGTAGLRGVIGAGTNRMNIYTVRKTTQGLANYIKANSKDNLSVAIAHDSRIKARLFSKEAAAVLAANGIKVYITKELEPTPVLSFAVREFSCNAGIMITASHNPAKYNGYKCYGPDGCQMTDFDAGCVYKEIQKTDIFTGYKTMDFEQAVKEGLIEYIEDGFYEKYLDMVSLQAVNKDICKDSNLKVVYTPLNGAGNKLVRAILSRIGVSNVSIVKEQENPDGNFPTCPYPNPEIREALEQALKLAQEDHPDLVLATDPDCDRVGIAVKDENLEYKLLTGNEVGILLINYILSCREKLGNLPKNPVAVRTVVSSIMVDKIAKKYGCELRTVLTGFKYIGEQILNLEKVNEQNRFVFGFEESYGYLVGTYVRDKDAVVASMLICEMAAYYRKQDKSLLEVLSSLYNEYGYYKNQTLSFSFEGASGMQKMQDIMNSLRNNPLEEIAGMKVLRLDDYNTSTSIDKVNNTSTTINLPKSNVISYSLEGGNAAIIRPSGTEPKIKFYITSVGNSIDDAKNINDKIAQSLNEVLK